jgi:nitrite reductase/ring-hydroxylating ferredoxin subunit
VHHWRFELATGRCITSDDDEHHLRTERIAD